MSTSTSLPLFKTMLCLIMIYEEFDIEFASIWFFNIYRTCMFVCLEQDYVIKGQIK